VDTKSQEEPIGVALTRTVRVLSRAFDANLAERGGSLATWLVLLSVTGEHRSQRSISAEVGVEGPTLTHHLNRMESDGLVTRVSFDERLRAGFTDDELATLRVLLQRIAANAAMPSDAEGKVTR
jgi:MarR family transcriptional regulator for hemolysin